MILKPLRCPFCGAPIKTTHDRYVKCDFCRGRFVVENSQEDIQIMPKREVDIRNPEDLENWNEFWEAVFDGGYYDIDEVKK